MPLCKDCTGLRKRIQDRKSDCGQLRVIRMFVRHASFAEFWQHIAGICNAGSRQPDRRMTQHPLASFMQIIGRR